MSAMATERGRRFARRSMGSFFVIAMVLIAVETGLRLYPGRQLEPLPAHRRQSIALHRALLTPDPHRMERLRAGVQLSMPPRELDESIESHSGKNPVAVATNSHGLRMREIELRRDPGISRIALLGDSVTFGWNVEEERCHARLLETYLRRGGFTVEALNFGVPGYSSAQGLAQYRESARVFEPDIVVIAFGFNDFSLRRGMPDSDRLEKNAAMNPWLWQIRSALSRSALLRLLGWIPEHDSTLQCTLRVSPSSFQTNIESLVHEIRSAGAAPILSNLCFPHARTGDLLREISADLGVPYLDGRAVLLGTVDPPFDPLVSEAHVEIRATGPTEEIVAIALPTGPAPLSDVSQLDQVALPLPQADERGGWIVRARLGAPGVHDWAFVPRSYLESAPHALERISTLYFHRVRGGTAEHPYRSNLGRFLDDRYLATDAPFFPLMSGEPIHPNEEGHARIAERLTELLIEECADRLRREPR